MQIAAHAYSDQVLEAAQQKKATPKFERAKSMTFDDRRIVYISGTAAIRGEESLVGVGLGRQLHITMENIGQLIGKAKLKMLRVYLKEKSFYEEARELLEGYNLNRAFVHIPGKCSFKGEIESSDGFFHRLLQTEDPLHN